MPARRAAASIPRDASRNHKAGADAGGYAWAVWARCCRAVHDFKPFKTFFQGGSREEIEKLRQKHLEHSRREMQESG